MRRLRPGLARGGDGSLCLRPSFDLGLKPTAIPSSVNRSWILNSDETGFVASDGYGSGSVRAEDKTTAILTALCARFRASGLALTDPAQLQAFNRTAEERAVVDR